MTDARLHLNKPWYIEFGYFVEDASSAATQNGWPGLGYSYGNYVSVRSEIIQRAPRTLWLIAGRRDRSGSSSASRSACSRRSSAEPGSTASAMGFALFGISAPVFWLGLMALYIVWKELGLTDGTGYVAALATGSGPFLGHMILPWIVLALLYMAIYARLTRNNLLETLGEDYIRTARAKGLSERRVILKHGLRASLTPIVTIFGLDMRAARRRRDHHRVGLQHPGPRLARLQRRRDAGPADRARRRHLHRDRGRRHEPRRRHRLRLPRPARAVRLMSAAPAARRCSTSAT